LGAADFAFAAGLAFAADFLAGAFFALAALGFLLAIVTPFR
jgi:hypothetical protein